MNWTQNKDVCKLCIQQIVWSLCLKLRCCLYGFGSTLVSSVPMCSSLYCSLWAKEPERTDSSAKQKYIGLLADGWGSTLSQTLSLCSQPFRHPSCERTHCAHSVSPCELSTSTHYVWRRQGSLSVQFGLFFWSCEDTAIISGPLGFVLFTSTEIHTDI